MSLHTYLIKYILNKCIINTIIDTFEDIHKN